MLKGQWFGPYAGTHSGNIIAEFDEIGGDLVGTVTAYPGDSVPPAFTEVTISTGRETFEAVLPLQPIDFRTGNPVPWEMIAGQHPGLNMSRAADTKWSLSPDHTLYLSWVTDLGNHGIAVLRQGAPNVSPALKPLSVTSWPPGSSNRTSAALLSHHSVLGHSSCAIDSRSRGDLQLPRPCSGRA
jgi:hypothetical protein